VTATRDRHSDLEHHDDEPAWDERPIIGASRGLPWWGAVAVALGLTAIAAVVDMQRSDTLGKTYQIVYVVSCVVAIAWVRRRSVFTAMVQPPLVFAVTFVGGYLFFGNRPAGDGMKQFALSVGLPLANNFPTMAIGTAIVLLIGGVRLFTQRNPDKADDDNPHAGKVDDLAGPPPPLREVRGRRAPRDEVAPPAARGRFSRGNRPDEASAERAARADRAERAGNPDRRRQGNRAEGVDRPARGERGGAVPPERRGRGERGERAERGRPRTEPGADRGERRGRADRDPRAAGRPARDDRGRATDPRRSPDGGGRPQPPRRRPREER
jgi:hypothetical protein